ncbi:MAG: hypothetical protein R3A80_07970 [Bdellovibrionota bacterium]
MLLKTFKFQFLALILMASCQSLKSPKTSHLEISDIIKNFEALPKETQKTALENGWTYFTYVFSYPEFQNRVLSEFPSLNITGKKQAL